MKRFENIIFYFVLIYCVSQSAFSQVGIGTTNPDASSILDVTSTTQGMLTPRMTTTQRLAISSPVKGLMVFDTDENVFYFYDGSTWMPLESAEKRDNYKLIKSATDLATELAAGSGAEYLLDENTLYEINGTISLAAPINLNDAYIIGLDANEDILLRTGGTIFSGSSGGAIKNLTLVAPGGSIFNLTGSGTENLIFRDCIIANSASVGSISSFDLFFLSIVQFVNNTTGITYTNINQLLLNNAAWDGTNGGVYETLIGDFGEIAKQGGFSEVVGATAAMDITGITSISGDAGIGLVDFFGGGNYINGNSPYVGYDFTREWDVNCPGIKLEIDAAATGCLYMATSTATTFSSTNTPIKVAGTTSPVNLFRTTSPVSNRLVYDGKKTRYVTYSGSMSAVSSGNNIIYNFYVAKNGSILPESKQSSKTASGGDVSSISISGVVEVSTGDYLELWMENTTNTNSFTIESMNFIMR